MSNSCLHFEEADELVAQLASPGSNRLGRADHAPYTNGWHQDHEVLQTMRWRENLTMSDMVPVAYLVRFSQVLFLKMHTTSPRYRKR